LDLISNKSSKYTPKGMNIEILNYKKLKNYKSKIKKRYDKEHMLNYFYKEKKIKKKIIINKIFKKFVNVNFSIDRQKDLDFINNIYKKIKFEYKINNKKLLQIIR
jgi:spore coat polysaccharide biosynthesis protein SpsF (cytidylyltransferase family)